MPVTKNRLYLLILCSLFAALCAIGAFIKVPLAWLPITLQTFFSTLAGLLLGKKWGTVSVVVYLLLGLIGLPIFTQGGGIGYVTKPTLGFLLGLAPATFVPVYCLNAPANPGLPLFLRRWQVPSFFML